MYYQLHEQYLCTYTIQKFKKLSISMNRKYFLSCLNVGRQTIYAFVKSYVVCCMIGFD